MSSWVDHHRFKVLALVLTLASGPPLAITYWDYFFPPEHGLTYEQFIDVQEALRTKLKAETADAVWQERQRYQSQLLEVEARLADPGIAYQNALAKIADLEELLESQSSISAARINEAKEALAKGDYSEADAIFAEVQRDGADAVQQVAAAAYGQGEIAEAEIRWHDAAAHYAKAARLDPNFDTLKKAREYAWRSGDYRKSLRYGEDLLELAQTDPSISDEQRATAMNEQALSLRDLGFYGKAEQLYRQAIEIHKATIGTAHPDYAKGLNNLAGLLRTTGRYDEAEPLYRQAIEIDKATIGTSHPDYAIHLNNLALLLETTGRYDEAEQLYRQAIEIDEATIGTSHPGDATDLNNLALLLETTGRYDEA
ncbi:MAG: tetratricopeptide repeat protein, partial [Mangrovicoccus sp.]